MKSKNDIINFIIENIKSSIDEEWDLATLRINVSDNFSSYKGFYLLSNEKKYIKVSRFNQEIDLDLIDFHKITTLIEPEVQKWNIAYFKLDRKGNYEIEFVWDQELFDSVYTNQI